VGHFRGESNVARESSAGGPSRSITPPDSTRQSAISTTVSQRLQTSRMSRSCGQQTQEGTSKHGGRGGRVADVGHRTFRRLSATVATFADWRCREVTDHAPHPNVSAMHARPVDTESRPAAELTSLDADTRRTMLQHMLVTRGVDDEAALLQNQGVVDLWLSCRGQEAAQVASGMAVGDSAVIFPSYREHAVAVVRGIDAVSLVAQWAGRTYCGWKPRQHRFFPYTLVVAAQTLHAVGFAIAQRLRNVAETVVVYVGDGATSEGDMSEAMNLAAVESAQVLFICQNNGWAISKPSREQALTSIAARAQGFGIRSWSIPADDPDSTYLHCLAARRYVETSRSPGLIELQTTRIGGHSSSDSHTAYRDPEELVTAAANDPVTRYCDRLLAAGVVDTEWLDRVEADIDIIRRRLVEEFGR
jgi:2-oxoisovalerate dehydrogenase E1 component alpha subunit